VPNKLFITKSQAVNFLKTKGMTLILFYFWGPQ
jgi:hypothetical protein